MKVARKEFRALDACRAERVTSRAMSRLIVTHRVVDVIPPDEESCRTSRAVTDMLFRQNHQHPRLPISARGFMGKMMTRVGFEPTPGYPDEKPAAAGKLSLESHALDRSAILPCNTQLIAEIRAYPRLYDLKSEVRGKVWARKKGCDIHRQQIIVRNSGHRGRRSTQQPMG